jgi:hypothetical protein
MSSARSSSATSEMARASSLPPSAGVSIPIPVVNDTPTTTVVAGSGARAPNLSNGVYVNRDPITPDAPPDKAGTLRNGFSVAVQRTTTPPAAPIVAAAARPANAPSTDATASAPTAPTNRAAAPVQARAPASVSPAAVTAAATGAQGARSFLDTLTTGKYAEVKQRLQQPDTLPELEARHIQVVDSSGGQDRVFGSMQPVIILKDLGDKFAIFPVRVR